MSPLASLAFALIVSLARSPAVDLSDPAEVRRLEATALDIAIAAELQDGAPFRGEARVEALAVALVVTAFGESGFRRDVADCRVTGDAGRSISLFQLHAGRAWGGHRRAEICRNQALAAYLAAGVLGLHRGSGSVAGFFRGYASGDRGVDSAAARARCGTWERTARLAGIAGAECWRPGFVSYLPTLDR